MEFNEKLIFLRKRAALSQEDLANILGISRQSISKWELGECEPNISKIQLLAKQFGVSIEFLINNEINVCHDSDIVSSADKTDKEEKVSQIETQTTEVKFNLNYWFVFIIIGFVGIVISAIIPYVFEHLYCFTGHSGFIGYLEDWCAEAIVWKFGLLISIALFTFGTIKTFYTSKNNKKN